MTFSFRIVFLVLVLFAFNRGVAAEPVPIIWGKETNGVRASLNVVAKPLSLAYPNELGIFVVLENRSEEPVSYVISDNGKGVSIVVRWAALFEKKEDLFSRYRVKPGVTFLKPGERRVIGCTMAFVRGRQLKALDGKEVRAVLEFVKVGDDKKSLKKFKVKTNTLKFVFAKRA